MIDNHRQYYVYMLTNPLKGNQPFYVGKGKGNRHQAHFKESLEHTNNPHKVRTIKLIEQAGLTVGITKVSSNLSENEAYELEANLISKYGRAAIDSEGILTNICLDARPPNYSHMSSEKQKLWSKNISNGNLRAWSDGTREITESMKDALGSLHEIQKGSNHPRYGTSFPSIFKGETKETCEAIAKGAEKRTGQKRSQETIDHMKAVQTEVQNRPEVRDAKSKALLGKPSGMLGKIHSDSAKQAIGKANSIKLKGRKRDPEAVRKSIETKKMKRLQNVENVN